MALEVVAAALVVLSMTPTASGQTAVGAHAADTTATSGAGGTPAFSASEQIERTFLTSTGSEQVVDGPRTFTVSVSQSSGLQNRQVVTVQWSGAHPTGGLIADQQGQYALLQEYPVVLMECHGLDSPNASPGEQISPSTCWTATPQERTLESADATTPPWYLDRYTTPSQRIPQVNAPSNYNAVCASQSSSSTVWLQPFVGADGTDYPVGPAGCAGEPPDMSIAQSAGVLPSDTTYAASDANGDGTAKFSIETADANAELGCSQTVPCSLVVIPIEGLSCDPTAALAAQPPDQSAIKACETTGVFSPGQPNVGNFAEKDLAVTGSLWYLPSNWRNHISVPLSFAPSADVCSQENKSAPLAIYGSEMLAEATAQWNPHFCLSSDGFNVTHVQTSEPEAKNLLATNAISAAFQAEPPSGGGSEFFPGPTVQAPVALSGFAISYVIDNTNGQPYEDLKLDARLLAKLMTESYPGLSLIQQGDTGIANSPLTLWDDPEFRALNPTLKVTDINPTQGQSAPAATLFSILGQSDVIYALTSYISADPVARSWLDGAPDPWGMTVNPAYKGIALPINSWPLLDTNEEGPLYNGGEGIQNDCLAEQPIPARPLLDAPQSSLEQVGLNLQFGIAQSQTSCTLVGNSFNFQPVGSEPVGARFLIGVVPLPLADEYSLDTAALQTYVSPQAAIKFTDDTDRTFVSPSGDTLKSAASLLQPDAADGSWTLPYADFATNSKTADAYPGTMLVSMDVPTEGLSQTNASELSQYLSYAAGGGQAPGPGIGQLPAGYLPLTSSNGLGDQLVYTDAAVTDVAAQNGAVPPLIPAPAPRSPTTTTVSPQSKSAEPTNRSSIVNTGSGAAPAVSTVDEYASGVGSSAGGAVEGGPGGSVPGKAGSLSSGGSGGRGSLSGSAAERAATGNTAAFGSGAGGWALPAAMVVALLGGTIAASHRFPRLRRTPK